MPDKTSIKFKFSNSFKEVINYDEITLRRSQRLAKSSNSYGCNWKQYFQEEVLPHVDPESWVEISKTRKLYEINFTKYFYKFAEQEPSTIIAERIKEREAKVTEMIKSIFED